MPMSLRFILYLPHEILYKRLLCHAVEDLNRMPSSPGTPSSAGVEPTTVV